MYAKQQLAKGVLLLALGISLTGCQLFQQQEPLQAKDLEQALSQHQATLLQQLAQDRQDQHDQLTQLQQQLSVTFNAQVQALKAQISRLEASSERFHRQHTFQVEQLDHQLTGNQPSMLARQEERRQAEVVNGEGQLILGRYEWIALPDAGVVFSARVDSGANTSSLHATDIQEFERDGQTWLRFNTPLENAAGEEQKIQLEAPLTRQVTIRQASGSEERPVVQLRIQLGSWVQDAEFTLTNRGKMTHPALLGRRFFMDVALIDVASTYIQPKPELSSQQSKTE